MKEFEGNAVKLTIDNHQFYGFGDTGIHESSTLKKHNDFFEELNKKENKIYEPLDLELAVTETPMDSCKMFTDDEFKQLLDSCNIKY